VPLLTQAEAFGYKGCMSGAGFAPSGVFFAATVTRRLLISGSQVRSLHSPLFPHQTSLCAEFPVRGNFSRCRVPSTRTFAPASALQDAAPDIATFCASESAAVSAGGGSPRRRWFPYPCHWRGVGCSSPLPTQAAGPASPARASRHPFSTTLPAVRQAGPHTAVRPVRASGSNAVRCVRCETIQ